MAGSELRRRLAGLPAPEAQRMLTGLVTELAAAALRRPPGEPVAADGTFFETGLRLADRGGAAQPAESPRPAWRCRRRWLFDYPTPGRARPRTC